MKRITLILVALALIVTAGILSHYDDVTAAEKPKGQKLSEQFHFALGPDTTKAIVKDTFLTYTGSSSKLFKFDVSDYGSCQGHIYFEYTAVDTGGGNPCDSANDSLAWWIYTGTDGDDSAYKLIYIGDTVTAVHPTATVAAADYQVIPNLADSSLWDNIYFRIEPILADSTYAQGRLEAELHYKATVRLWAR